MHNAVIYLYWMKQGAHESNDHYLAHYKSNITAVELTGSELYNHIPNYHWCKGSRKVQAGHRQGDEQIQSNNAINSPQLKNSTNFV